jgi:hypothetical protein
MKIKKYTPTGNGEPETCEPATQSGNIWAELTFLTGNLIFIVRRNYDV